MADYGLPLCKTDVLSFQSQGVWQLRVPLEGLPDSMRNADGTLACRAGDRIWVKEGFAKREDVDGVARPTKARRYAHYRANYAGSLKDEWHAYKGWVPGVRMPRWASRLTLHVHGAWVEKLQNISSEDALANGVQRVIRAGETCYIGLRPDMVLDGTPTGWAEPRDAFSERWDADHSCSVSKDDWRDNPSVAAFSVIPVWENIDAALETTDKEASPVQGLAGRLSDLSMAASPGPWSYRPEELDDWGMIRSFPSDRAPVAMVSRAHPDDDRSHDQHRSAGTDPYAANGIFVTELVNAYRAGRLKVVE